MYQFFMKSTLLKQCIDQYTSANTELDKSKDIIKEKKSGLEEIRKKFEAKSREYKEVMKFASWEEDEKKYSHEYVVALNREKAKEVETTQADIEKKNAHLDKVMDKLKTLKSNNGDLMSQKDALEVQLGNEKDKYAEKEAELHNYKVGDWWNCCLFQFSKL